MPTQIYTKKSEMFTAIEYKDGNEEEMVEFCPYCRVEPAGLMFKNTVLEEGWFVFCNQLDEWFYQGIDFVDFYGPVSSTKSVPMGLYSPRSIVAVEGVVWRGDNFMEVQIACPQAVNKGAVVGIPGPIDVYVGEMVLRELATGKFSKMEAELFSVFYEMQTL